MKYGIMRSVGMIKIYDNLLLLNAKNGGGEKWK
jgi:hypothetical protein